MKKSEFLDSLKKRLDVLEQSEIDDIAAEYSEHIDEKIKSGATEEDAVRDLGDINEIVSETLAAYKVKDKYSNKSEVTDSLGRAFSQFVGVFAKILDNISKKNSSEIIKIVLEIILMLLLIAVLKLPIEILKGFGSTIFEMLFFPLGNILNFIWIFVIEISYFVLAIALLFTIIKNRYLSKDEISEIKRNFKENEAFTRGKDDIKKAASEFADDFKEAGAEIGREFNSVAEEIKNEFKPRKVEEANRKRKYEYEYEDNFVFKVFSIIFKVFVFLLIIPAFFTMIAFIIAFGFMIVLIVNGIIFVGPILAIAGLMGFSIFLFEVMVRALQSKAMSTGKIISSIVVSFILIGVGSALTAGEFAFADYVNKAPEGIEVSTYTKTYEYEDIPGILKWYRTKYIADEEMGTEVKIEVIYYKDFTNPKLMRSDDYISVDYYSESSYKGKKMFDIFKKDLREKTFHNYTLLYEPKVNVYLSQESYNKYKEYMVEQDHYFEEDFYE